MIPRRIYEHAKAHNWFAVAIDFVIVVVGVFIGIQVSNWNTAQGDKAEYERALDRLAAETQTNLKTLDSIEPQIEKSLEIARQALDVLQSCVENEENRRILDAGLAEIRGTWGMHLRRKAVEDLTSNPRLLAQQSAVERARFTDMLFVFDLMRQESDFAEFHARDRSFTHNPMIRVGAPEVVTFDYYGDWTKTRRPLFLNVPIDEACRDDPLIKAFFTWDTWQQNVPIFIRRTREELDATGRLLEERR